MRASAPALRSFTRRAVAGSGRRRRPAQLWRYLAGGGAATWLTTPVIYSTLAPFLILDLWVSVYQAACFRAWGLRRVRRRRFIVIDRHRLAYLNGLEKLNCVFCGYVNGVIAYTREIAARTEQYWCPIRHERAPRGAHARYRGFVPYRDPLDYRRRLTALRADLKK